MDDPARPWWRRKLPTLLLAGSPCLAAAMTAGVAAADLFLLPRAMIGAGIGDDLVIGGNAALAFAGAAAGGLLSGGSGLRRAALAVGAGAVGVAGYFGTLFALLAFAPMG